MFDRIEQEGVAAYVPERLAATPGVLVAFSERTGGTSVPPYASLDLAGHVGDEPSAVDANRQRLLELLSLGQMADRLTTAEQVHGSRIVEVTRAEAGSGARVSCGPGPVPAADALWTREQGVPLLLLFADCVPVVLVRPSIPAVAVVHAGWKGAAAGIVGATARTLQTLGGEDDCRAFVGPHIGPCCYEVGPDVVSHFGNAFVTITAASSHLDLGAVVAEDLKRSGVPKERQWHLGICTAHSTDRFYSYRAEGLTGRHGALAVIL